MTLVATAWGGTTSTWREKQALSFSRGDGRTNFIEGLRMISLKEVRQLLVYFYIYDGVISNEKFVPLYDEI